MLISTSTCPLCQRSISGQELRCPNCHSVIQIHLEPPDFARTAVVQQLVYPVLQTSRRQIALNQGTGYDFYVLGLGYLNYEMPAEGMELWSHAAALLPEQHRIHFELAMIHYTRGEYSEGLREIERAVELAPDNREYGELRRRLRDASTQVGNDLRPAIERWISVYEQDPNSQQAAQALRQFIAANEARLTQPIAPLLRTLSPADAARLWTLNDNPADRVASMPGGPKAPPTLGKRRLALLRSIAPERAEALEQMHEERTTAYEKARGDYEAEQHSLQARHSAATEAWEHQVAQIRDDLPLMARLCLALVAEESRLAGVVEQRKEDLEARGRDHALQDALIKNTPRPSNGAKEAAPTPPATPMEKRYVIARAIYRLGLPLGKDADVVALSVTNLSVTIFHPDTRGRWKWVTPTDNIVEAAEETLRRAGEPLDCLRLSFRDENGELQHVFLSGLDMDNADAVRRIEQAMGRAPYVAASGTHK